MEQFMIKKNVSMVQAVYLLSLLFFSSSMLLLSLHSIKSNFSLLSVISFLKFSVDRNHMFLLCNGILVILVKSSSLTQKDSNKAEKEEVYVAEKESIQLGTEKKEETIVFADLSVSDDAVELQEHIKRVDNVVTAQVLTIEETTVVEEMVITELSAEHGHDEDDYDDENDGLAAEELNKRCEEFIRRMKQGIISESREDMILSRFS